MSEGASLLTVMLSTSSLEGLVALSDSLVVLAGKPFFLLLLVLCVVCVCVIVLVLFVYCLCLFACLSLCLFYALLFCRRGLHAKREQASRQ